MKTRIICLTLLINTIIFCQSNKRQSLKNDFDPVLEAVDSLIIVGTPNSREHARSILRTAIHDYPFNTDYRIKLGLLLEDFAYVTAFNTYKEIIEEIDSTCSEAWFRMGVMREKEFYDYYNSFKRSFSENDVIVRSQEEFTGSAFSEAELYFRKAIESSGNNIDALFHLCFLYEELSRFDKGIEILLNIKDNQFQDSRKYLYLGLLYYKNSQIEKSNDAFNRAFKLMPESEKQDYLVNSVLELMSPVLPKPIEELNNYEKEKLIEQYWNFRDPLLLSDFNERKLEHFSRVAYADLRFSISSRNIRGWRTNRGEMVLRYGEPIRKMRYRPYAELTGFAPKTDVWIYDDKILGFTDDFMSGEFKYAEKANPFGGRIISQFYGDTHTFVENLKKQKNEEYNPKFDGPSFTVPLNCVSFRNDEDENKTDVYFNYGINNADEGLKAGYTLGLFQLDDYFNRNFERKLFLNDFDYASRVNLKIGHDFFVNSVKITSPPVSVNIAFELIRNFDKGVFSSHGKMTIKNYYGNDLLISDILLAAKIDIENTGKAPVQRNKLGIYPNPENLFNARNPVNIYYEIYNLRKDNNNLTDFEQIISLRRQSENEEESGLAGFLNNIGETLGISEEEGEIIISSNYQTIKTNPEIFLQLDMMNYEPGTYILKITIRDKVGGSEVSGNAVIKWER